MFSRSPLSVSDSKNPPLGLHDRDVPCLELRSYEHVYESMRAMSVAQATVGNTGILYN